jgi:hypothetical protein
VELPAASPSKQRHDVVVLLTAVVSVVAAFSIAASQEQSLGDDPSAMIAFGCLLAFGLSLLRWSWAILTGAAAMFGFPAWAVTDLVLHGGHNLLGIELAIYGVLGVLAGLLGSWIGSQVTRILGRGE